MARLSSPLKGEAVAFGSSAFSLLAFSAARDSSPCVEGSAFDAYEGGGWNATDLARQRRQWTAPQRAG